MTRPAAVATLEDQEDNIKSLSIRLRKQVDEVFAIMDINGDGSVTSEEVAKHWKSSFSGFNIVKFFKEMDANGDGEISKEEF